jgi:hypothetical protein
MGYVYPRLALSYLASIFHGRWIRIQVHDAFLVDRSIPLGNGGGDSPSHSTILESTGIPCKQRRRVIIQTAIFHLYDFHVCSLMHAESENADLPFHWKLTVMDAGPDNTGSSLEFDDENHPH